MQFSAFEQKYDCVHDTFIFKRGAKSPRLQYDEESVFTPKRSCLRFQNLQNARRCSILQIVFMTCAINVTYFEHSIKTHQLKSFAQTTMTLIYLLVCLCSEA